MEQELDRARMNQELGRTGMSQNVSSLAWALGSRAKNGILQWQGVAPGKSPLPLQSVLLGLALALLPGGKGLCCGAVGSLGQGSCPFPGLTDS